MKRIIVLAILIITASFLRAQSPRILSMGNVQGFIPDSQDIFTYPTSIYNYTNTAYGYLGENAGDLDNYTFGVNYKYSKYTLGIYFNKYYYDYLSEHAIYINPQTGESITLYLADFWYVDDNLTTDLELKNSVEIILGLDQALAFEFLFARDKCELTDQDDPDSKYEASAYKIGLGIGAKGDQWEAGLHYKATLEDEKAYYNNEMSEETTYRRHKISFNERATLKQYNTTEFVGLVDVEYLTFEEKREDYLISLDIFRAGISFAAVIKPDKENTIVAGILPISIEQINFHPSSTRAYNIPKINIGFESKLLSWLTARGGIEQYYYIMTTKDIFNGNEEKYTENFSRFDFNLGLGINYKGVTIDTVFNEALLHNSANFISGINTPKSGIEILIMYKF